MTSNEARLVAAEMRARIALATAAAIFVAGVILVAAILPAEYRVDPLGSGKALGLTQLAQTRAEGAPAGEGAAASAGELEPVRPGANTPQRVPLKEDHATFKLGPLQGIEYKYQMEKGSGMVYTWTTTGNVKFDFHGEPKGAPKGYAESYEMSEGQSASGIFFAPTTGIHGWYWENLTTSDVTVTLTSTGFYASGVEFAAGGQVVRDLQNVNRARR